MKSQKGFTLVELVIVVLILGILAAVAVPRLFNTSSVAIDNGVKQSLSVIRDAIELYAAENLKLPAQSTTDSSGVTTAGDLKIDLENYLRGPFPNCPVGNATTPGGIKYSSGASTVGESSPTNGWHYNTLTGEFIINCDLPSNTDASVRYDEF